eukprot:8517912-Alexandrium_andersonii.AAC.1
MSASLVGSEMCIRDSGSSRQFRTLLAIFGLRPSVRSTSSKRLAPPKAVSYTHLTLPTICSV